MTASVERVFYSCSRCNDEHRTVEQREAAERAAVEAVRLENALLAPKQIRKLREELGLTTEQLGDLLYGIPRTIVEGWEKGRYVQNRDVNAMLLKLEDPDYLRERAARAGVVLPEPEVPVEDADAGEGGALETNVSEAFAAETFVADASESPGDESPAIEDGDIENHTGSPLTERATDDDQSESDALRDDPAAGSPR